MISRNLISLHNLSPWSLIIIFFFCFKQTCKDDKRKKIRPRINPVDIRRNLNWNIFWMSIKLSVDKMWRQRGFAAVPKCRGGRGQKSSLSTSSNFFALIKINWKSRKIVDGILDLYVIIGLVYNWNASACRALRIFVLPANLSALEKYIWGLMTNDLKSTVICSPIRQVLRSLSRSKATVFFYLPWFISTFLRLLVEHD